MSFSPYSEKARWALDHHRVPYVWREHVPLLGEIPLRARTRTWRGRVSVPLIVDGPLVVTDSTDIARYAERIGRGEQLFAEEAAVLTWAQRSTAALAAGRVTMLARLLEDREALHDSAPRFIPRAVRSAALPAVVSTVRFLQRKYATRAVDHDRAQATMREVLLTLRSALAYRETVLADFSFADIAMAVVLQMVSPVANAYIPLRKAQRRAWSDATLAREFADLVEWRDRVYAKRRRGSA